MKKYDIKEVAQGKIDATLLRDLKTGAPLQMLCWERKNLYYLEEHEATEAQTFEDIDKRIFLLVPTPGWRQYLDNNNVAKSPEEDEHREISSEKFIDSLEARDEVLKDFIVKIEKLISARIAQIETPASEESAA